MPKFHCLIENSPVDYDYGKIIGMKKTQRKKSNLVKISLIAVLTVAILCLGLYVRSLLENKKEGPTENPLPDQTYTVTLDDYKVYQFMDVQYDFIMANITITSNRNLTLPQNPFVTSENINLANTAEYTSYLKSQGYDLKCPNAESTTDLTLTRCLFIPVINRALNDLVLKVTIDKDYNLSFNINDIAHAGTREMLGKAEPKPDFVATTITKKLLSKHSFYRIDVDGNREDAIFPANSQVFGFQITLENNTQSAFKVDNAYITIDGKGTFQCVDPTFKNDDVTPIIGIDITSMKSGYLFIEITNPSIDINALKNENIHVLIKLSNKSSYIEVLFMGATQ